MRLAQPCRSMDEQGIEDGCFLLRHGPRRRAGKRVAFIDDEGCKVMARLEAVADPGQRLRLGGGFGRFGGSHFQDFRRRCGPQNADISYADIRRAPGEPKALAVIAGHIACDEGGRRQKIERFRARTQRPHSDSAQPLVEHPASQVATQAGPDGCPRIADLLDARVLRHSFDLSCLGGHDPLIFSHSVLPHDQTTHSGM